jgi:hypothetical protein
VVLVVCLVGQRVADLLQIDAAQVKAPGQDRPPSLPEILDRNARPAAEPDVLGPVGMDNHASSRAIRASAAVLIVGPELCSRHAGRS